MNIMHNNLITPKRGTTLIEIMTALLILAFTFLPILATIGTASLDTDVQNATVFAQTLARNILDTLLDDVPFNSLKATPGKYSIAELVDYASPSKSTDYKVDMFKTMIGAKGSKAEGEVTDDLRGTVYKVKIYVYPIPANNSTCNGKASGNELYFTHLPRPKYETKYDNATHKSYWYTYKKANSSQYITDYGGANTIQPYSNKDECKVERVIQNAFDLGAVDNYGSRCILKKIMLVISWQGRDKKDRSLVLYTMKGNLDSEK